MKKLLFTLIFGSCILYSCFFPEVTLEASKTGIMLWFQQILPALLPFTIVSSILTKSNFLHSFSGNVNTFAIILTIGCGFIFGFPIGAKLSADFYKSGLLNDKQAMCLAICTNNFSPMYICGYVLPTLFSKNQYHRITYLLIYFLPLLIVTILCILYSRKSHSIETVSSENLHKKSASPFHLDMGVMDAGIISGFESLIRICGYIVLFSIVAKILTNLWTQPPFLWNWTIGNLEISNGIHLLSISTATDDLKYIAAIQLLSFGGLSGIAQTASIFHGNAIADKKLSIYKYIIGKVFLSLLFTLLAIMYVSF